jgi:hypothetical protein
MDLIEMQRTRSPSNKNAEKSTKRTVILPLITVWLQVRVLPGPPWAFFDFEIVGLFTPIDYATLLISHLMLLF